MDVKITTVVNIFSILFSCLNIWTQCLWWWRWLVYKDNNDEKKCQFIFFPYFIGNRLVEFFLLLLSDNSILYLKLISRYNNVCVCVCVYWPNKIISVSHHHRHPFRNENEYIIIIVNNIYWYHFHYHHFIYVCSSAHVAQNC